MLSSDERRAHARAACRRWYANNREKHKADGRRYRMLHRLQQNARHRAWAHRNPDKVAAVNRKQRARPDHNAYMRRWRQQLKRDVLQGYGSVCVCCGEHRPDFLSIDHINGGGAAERKRDASFVSTRFYARLKREGFPREKYRLLCMNCNFARRFGQECPHEAERLSAVA